VSYCNASLTSQHISIKLVEELINIGPLAQEEYVSIKRFAFASVCFTLVSLSLIFGIAFTMGKYVVPPSFIDAFIKNTLGSHGPLIVYITLSVLGAGLVFLVTKKLFYPKVKSEL
jgi:hypothetical protein